MRVFVLLFNANSDNEGIHTLKMTPANSDGELQDVVLAFEEEDDATRFALMLEAQDFPAATVESIDREELEAFCSSAGLGLQDVPAGMLATPPETNVDQTDWQPEEQSDAAETQGTDDLEAIRRQLEKLL